AAPYRLALAFSVNHRQRRNHAGGRKQSFAPYRRWVSETRHLQDFPTGCRVRRPRPYGNQRPYRQDRANVLIGRPFRQKPRKRRNVGLKQRVRLLADSHRRRGQGPRLQGDAAAGGLALPMTRWLTAVAVVIT